MGMQDLPRPEVSFNTGKTTQDNKEHSEGRTSDTESARSAQTSHGSDYRSPRQRGSSGSSGSRSPRKRKTRRRKRSSGGPEDSWWRRDPTGASSSPPSDVPWRSAGRNTLRARDSRFHRSRSDGAETRRASVRARSISDPAPSTPPRLIVLDLDGVLWTRERRAVKHTEDVDLFLQKCFMVADVGFYTSSSYKNVSAALKELLSPEQFEMKAFMWTRKMCDKAPTPESPYATQKPLRKVYQHFARSKGYGPHTTVIVDDSSEKVACNPAGNCVVVEEDCKLEETFDRLMEAFDRLEERAQLRRSGSFSSAPRGLPSGAGE